MKLQEAVKKETIFISCGCVIATVICLLLFFVLNRFFPEQIPFGMKVIISGVIGCAVAVLNFFWMAVTVQKVTSIEDEGRARSVMALSYRNRMLLQLLWAVLSFALPVFNGAMGIIPLFVPSVLIKCRGIFQRKEGMKTK
ncbi:MAG: ATP synthase subunit I [Lachnospiraceae bacterium]|nr:ATP synthase subunit I [Lachnospiraceae bacterium]